MPEAELHVEVVSQIELLWTGKASYVSIPAVDGRLGILKNRQPVLAVLESGIVEISSEDGLVTVSVDGGFASVDSDFVTIVAKGGKIETPER